MPSFLVLTSGMLCLLFVFQAHANELACGPDADPCPAHSRCVPGAGCVSIDRTAPCRCNKERACPWSQKCDCNNGCEPIKCSTTASCGRNLLNPRNPCQQLNCSASSHTCQIVPVHCAGGARCDRAHGCQAPVETERAEAVALSARKVKAADVDPTPGKSNAWVITMIVIMSLLALLWLCFAIYAMYQAWRPSSRVKGTI